MKKTIALLLCLLLTFGSVSLTALAEAEPVTLTMFVDETWWPYHDWSGDMPRWFTEQTGVQFDVSVAADITELDMMVASGSYPDVIVSPDFNLLSNSGVCYDWDTLLETYNIDAAIHPAYKFVNQAADGKMYTIMVGWSADYEYDQYPDVNPEGVMLTAREDLLNECLAELGLETLTTVEQLEACFDLIQKNHPEVIPFASLPLSNVDPWLYAYYGAAYKGLGIDGDRAQAWINMPGIKDALLTMNRWVQKGYMSKENFSWTSNDTMYGYAYSGNVFVQGALTNAAALADEGSAKAGTNYSFVPLTDLKSDSSAIYTTATGWRGFFITKNCSNPEAAMKAALALYSKDIGYSMLWGKEGEDWNWNEDKTIASFNYDVTLDADLRDQRQLWWGWLGHDGISNNMAYAANPKTREALRWVGSINHREPVLGLIMNSLDADSREYVIYQQLQELEDNYTVRIAMAPNAEEAEALYAEMLSIAGQIGVDQFEAWANERYAELSDAYEAVRYIGAEGWEK